MQRSELLIPAQPFTGRDLLRLFSDIKTRGPDVFVDPRLLAAVREWTPDSPKTEAKGVILVRGPWDETSGSPDLPFDINQSQSFPGVCRD